MLGDGEVLRRGILPHISAELSTHRAFPMSAADLEADVVDNEIAEVLLERLSIAESRLKALHGCCTNTLPDSLENTTKGAKESVLMDRLLIRLSAAEVRVSQLHLESKGDPLDRVKEDLANKNVYSSVFLHVASDYYEKSLSERAKVLKCTVPQLCKSIIFENTAWVQENNCQFGDPTNSRFYLVLVQYEGPFKYPILFSLHMNH